MFLHGKQQGTIDISGVAGLRSTINGDKQLSARGAPGPYHRPRLGLQPIIGDQTSVTKPIQEGWIASPASMSCMELSTTSPSLDIFQKLVFLEVSASTFPPSPEHQQFERHLSQHASHTLDCGNRYLSAMYLSDEHFGGSNHC